MLTHERWYWPFPVARYIYSSEAIFLGQKVFGADRNALYKWCFGKLRKIADFGWQCQYRFNPKHRYHIVATGLKPGFYEADYRMLNACMALLVEYVDRYWGGAGELQKWLDRNKEMDAEDGNFHTDWTSPKVEIIAIYRWWTVDRPAELKKLGQLGHEVFSKISFGANKTEDGKGYDLELDPIVGQRRSSYDQYRALESKIFKDEEEMLSRLIKARRHLSD